MVGRTLRAASTLAESMSKIALTLGPRGALWFSVRWAARGIRALLRVSLGTLWIAHGAAAQNPPAEWLESLERVMPEADRFSDRRGRPPVFEAYRTDPSTGIESVTGYAFLTSDLPPEQKGFTGSIEVLVGMDLQGVLTGVVVTRYTESHRATRGDFLAIPGFQEQFTGKNIVDAFRVRRDVDGISGATISVDAMSRGIRNAARSVAVAYGLGPVSNTSEAPPLNPLSISLAELDELSWTEMLLRGLGQRVPVLDDDRTIADVTLVLLRDEAVAERLVGPGTLAEVIERAGTRFSGRHLVLATVDGPSAGALNLARLSIVQADDTVHVDPEDVFLFGQPREGKLDGQVRMFRVLLVDRVVDESRPFTFVLDLRPGLGVFVAEYPGEVTTADPVAGVGVGGATTTLPPEDAHRSIRWVALCLLFVALVVALLERPWRKSG